MACKRGARADTGKDATSTFILKRRNRPPRHCRHLGILLIPLFLLLSPSSILASTPAESSFHKPAVFDAVEELTLRNGMHFILLPRHDVPLISARLLVKVGNVDNNVGQTGLAHMFEHMAFKGTDRIGTRDHEAEMAIQDSVGVIGLELTGEIAKGFAADTTRIARLRVELERLSEKQAVLSVPNEFVQLLEAYAFDYNASTSEDFTNYYMEIPANHLEAWMLLESERFQFPSFREFYREVEIVKEERRQRTEDDPRGMAWELLRSMSFTAHPYRFPTIGYMSDLETLTHVQAQVFRKTYYVPSNAIGVLVGDFQPEDAKELLREYFGDIPSGPPPPAIPTVEPPQLGMRRATIRKGTERSIFIAFPGFHPRSRESSIAYLLSSVLSRDKTSRLDQRLDIQEQAVQSISASSSWGLRRYPGIFTIDARPLEGFSNEEIERMIFEELDRLQTNPVSLKKLNEIRGSYKKDYYYSLETNSRLARALQSAQAIHGDWRHTYERFSEYDEIPPEEITTLAAELFQRGKASIVYLEPEKTEEVNEEVDEEVRKVVGHE